MGLTTIAKGQILHQSSTDTVNTIEILVKGKIKFYDQSSSLILNVGGIAGLPETPGKPYYYTYEALEDSTVYSYPYNSTDDLPGIIRSNPKICSILAAQAADITYQLYYDYAKLYDDATNEYETLKAEYADYPDLCIKVGQIPQTFEKVDLLIPPEKPGTISEWEFDFAKSLKENEDSLKKTFYTIGPDICSGVVMLAVNNTRCIVEENKFLISYRKQLKRNTADFTNTMKMIHSKLDSLENANSGDGSSMISVINALNTILTYSGVSGDIAAKFEEQVNEFKNTETRYESSDEARALRRNIGSTFYEIYTPAFLKSLNDNNIPIEVKMFFMFGFVDEELAGDKNTTILYNMAKAYTPDPDGNVLTIYEWLKKIYNLEVDPSKNEFDQDWPAYLREQKTSGNLNQAQIEAMENDPKSRLDFEIHNLFSLGNRMTFGRISSFVPVFDAMNVLRPLDMAYQTVAKVNQYYENIRKVDYGVFCRQAVYSNPEIGITQLFFADDITPYMILMPNVGSRASLWQEIDGKNRRTKARMVISIFNTENTEECMIKLFGEFRWEMCKTEQGVHWNDVTDPSLTSMYCDYLQFYKKNPSLSTENKEKLKTDLKKFSNNYKNVFIADYLAYVKFEAAGSPRLNKVAREILFTFCPFAKELRESISDNPQYKELINHYLNHIANVAKPLQNIEAKLKREEIEIPDELTRQLQHLAK